MSDLPPPFYSGANIWPWSRRLPAESPDVEKPLHRKKLGFRIGNMVLAAVVAMAGLCGCADLTGQGPVKLAPLRPQDKARYRCEGHAYCMRGWLGIYSLGMISITGRIEKEAGIPATSLSYTEWELLSNYLVEEHAAGRWSGAVVLIGHSFGGDNQIRVAELLARHGISVDLMVLVDPNTPPTVPANVKRCVDIYKSHPGSDMLHILRGVRAEAADPARTLLTNIDLRTTAVGFQTDAITHENIDETPGVQTLVIKEIRKLNDARTHSR